MVPPSRCSCGAQLFISMNYGATDAELHRPALSMTVIKSIHLAS
jgi:hypothetical protein